MFLSTAELNTLLPNQISTFKKERINGVAYELSLGNQVYQTDAKNEKKQILDKKNSQIVIKPGQFALLLTEETVTIPKNIIAFISIKFKEKIKGLVNVSGFHVDPGFSGKIIFSVYNAGAAPIVMDMGKPYFLIWFSQLTSDAKIYDGKHQGQTEITAENVSALIGKIASPNVLLDKIKKNENKLNTVILAASILTTISIGFTVKAWTDSSKIKDAYEAGLKEKVAIEEVKNAIEQSHLNCVISCKVDSILKTKALVNDTTKKK